MVQTPDEKLFETTQVDKLKAEDFDAGKYHDNLMDEVWSAFSEMVGNDVLEYKTASTLPLYPFLCHQGV